MHVRMGVHSAGNCACLYDGQGHPFLRLRDGTHPLAAGSVKPRPLAQAGQIRPAPPAVARKPGPGPADRFAGQPGRASADSQARPGPRLPTLRPCSVNIGEARPEALPTLSLPTLGYRRAGRKPLLQRAERPVRWPDTLAAANEDVRSQASGRPHRTRLRS